MSAIRVEAAENNTSPISAEMLAELYRKPAITRAEYAEAVKTLIPLAQSDTSGSRAAAQVLLSAYNGNAYQLNIVDLVYLDWKHYDAAMQVIAGRIELRREPHELIESGDSIFRALFDSWKYLHVEQRAAASDY